MHDVLGILCPYHRVGFFSGWCLRQNAHPSHPNHTLSRKSLADLTYRKPVDKWLVLWQGQGLELSLGLGPRINHSWKRVGIKINVGIFGTF